MQWLRWARQNTYVETVPPCRVQHLSSYRLRDYSKARCNLILSSLVAAAWMPRPASN